LLKKLEIDYYNEQTSHRTIQRFFDDVLADKAALFFQYSVTGHDFNKAGESASRIKTTLKRLGFAPQIVRRVAIATYEAEMNLIIYTEGGEIRVRVEPHKILVRVEDSGPGIPDIEKALQPGYPATRLLDRTGMGQRVGVWRRHGSAEYPQVRQQDGPEIHSGKRHVVENKYCY